MMWPQSFYRHRHEEHVPMRIAPATSDDLPALVEIIRGAFTPLARRLGVTQAEHPEAVAFTTLESLSDFIRQRAVSMFVALDPEPVACGGWYADKDDPSVGWICRVAVRPESQGRGYGSAIVRRLLEEMARHGCHVARLRHADDCPVQHAFYTRLGFGLVETGDPDRQPSGVVVRETPLRPEGH
jgi:GNAT superfamily N-acetyltransferase